MVVTSQRLGTAILRMAHAGCAGNERAGLLLEPAPRRGPSHCRGRL
ncbi:hypothetical protein [Lysobacter gummosus]